MPLTHGCRWWIPARSIDEDTEVKPYIVELSEQLIDCFDGLELVDKYDVYAELDGREGIVSSLRLSADCGPVVLDTALDVSSREYDGERIYCVGKNALRLYTDGSSVVNANGTGVTDEENQLAGSANLLDAVHLACLNGDISAAQNGE